MELWLFFTIFGLIIFLPSGGLFLLLQRFKNTIVVLIKQNGALIKIIINNKILEKGQITQIGKRKIKPIKISKEEIYYGKWRRWIVKPELHSPLNGTTTDKEIEEYLNNEDLIKLYMAGKFKDTLILLIGATLVCVIIGVIINGYLINTKQCLDYSNSTLSFIKSNSYEASKQAIEELFNATR
jgi:hypothetical protein